MFWQVQGKSLFKSSSNTPTLSRRYFFPLATQLRNISVLKNKGTDFSQTLYIFSFEVRGQIRQVLRSCTFVGDVGVGTNKNGGIVSAFERKVDWSPAVHG